MGKLDGKVAVITGGPAAWRWLWATRAARCSQCGKALPLFNDGCAAAI
jgi:hypothetical protein